MDRLTAFVDDEPSDGERGRVRAPAERPDRHRQRRGPGQGLFNGTQNRSAYVPEQQTDFIFTVVGEELGFVGQHRCCSSSTALLILRIWRIAPLARDVSARCSASGCWPCRVPGLRERGHDHGHHADHRHPAAVRLLRRLVDPHPFAAIGLVLNVHMRRFRLTASCSDRFGRHSSTWLFVFSRTGRSRRPVGSPRMDSLWPQLEPLLAKVQKPARYIGCEDGAISPRPRPRARWPGCSIYPDTYEIGLPNQGLQILYEILNERADAVAERTYAPWADLEAQLRARGPAAVLGRHPPAAPASSTCWRSTCRPSSSTRTCSTASTWPACPCGPPTAAPSTRWSCAGGHCTYNPEPLADFVDFFVLGDGEEVVSEITEVVGAWKRGGPDRGLARRRCCASSAASPASTCPSMYERRLRRAPTSSRSTPRYPDVPDAGREAHRRRPRRLALPEATSSCRSPRSCTTGSTSRSSGAAPAGCRFCQAGMITRPVRERPAEQVRTMVQRGPAPHRLRRGRAHVAVHRRLLRHRAGRGRHRRRSR